MARFGKEDYIDIYKKYNVDRTWSFSKVETYKQSKYEYLLKYILKKDEDRNDSAYGNYGTLCHNIIENYYNGLLERKDMVDKYDTEALNLEMIGKKFDRTDEEKNTKIKNDYDICLEHFFKYHLKPQNKFITEKPVVLPLTQDIVLIGYIDLLEANNGILTITDFKTSTIYSSADMKNKIAQLVLYAEAIRQTTNQENFDKIKIQYNFLKYVKVSYLQQNGKPKERNIKRSELGEGLTSIVTSWLKKEEYEEQQINQYISFMTLNNSIEDLPKKIKDKITIEECIIPVEINTEIAENYKNNTISTIREIEENERLYYKDCDEKYFSEEVTTSESFYFANLSGYSMELHKPYKQYLVKNGLLVDTLKKQEQQNDINEDDLPWSTKSNDTNSSNNKQPINDKWKDLFGD